MREMGIPVQSATTSAITSSVTSLLPPWAGWQSPLVLMRAADSSMRSMALSGKLRSGKKRTESFTAANKASSVKWT